MAFKGVLLLFSLAVVGAQSVGSYTAHAEPSPHVAALGAFAFQSLQANSNSLDLAEVHFDKVLSAESQVVAGTNYKITIGTKPQGRMTFTIFEQPWTKTLEITEATHTPSDVALATVNLVSVESSVKLNAEEFERFEKEQQAPKAMLGEDGHGVYKPDEAAKEAVETKPEEAAVEKEAKKTVLGANGHGQRLGIWSWLKKKLRRK